LILFIKGVTTMGKPDEERISHLNPELLFRPCLATDPIGMEFVHDLGDPALVKQLVGIRLQTFANVYRAIADGAAEAAKMMVAQQAKK
jgi:hypothetical protein